jgi:glycyl-tRNA synthetase
LVMPASNARALMAACDCWDAEILMSSGWVECVGIADRSAYDLDVHATATGIELVAREPYPTPITVTEYVPDANKGVMGRTLKGDNAGVNALLLEVRKTKTHGETQASPPCP